MFTVFRRLLVCLLWLWLPVSQAADSGWLRAADNQHASVRLRAQTENSGETRLLLDVALEKGWKTYWRSPGEGGIAPAITWHQPLEALWRWPTPSVSTSRVSPRRDITATSASHHPARQRARTP
jgi:suppressor for copper-sensitivity B